MSKSFDLATAITTAALHYHITMSVSHLTWSLPPNHCSTTSLLYSFIWLAHCHHTNAAPCHPITTSLHNSVILLAHCQNIKAAYHWATTSLHDSDIWLAHCHHTNAASCHHVIWLIQYHFPHHYTTVSLCGSVIMTCLLPPDQCSTMSLDCHHCITMSACYCVCIFCLHVFAFWLVNGPHHSQSDHWDWKTSLT